MSIADWFVFKSKKEREAEQKRYRRFAFPYGDEQRARLEEILGELMPSEPRETALAIYLIGREGYRGSFKMDEEDRAERTEEEKQAAHRRMSWEIAENGLRKYHAMRAYLERKAN